MDKVDFSFNWPLFGNSQITEFLEKIIVKRVSGGTYIFNGPDNLGKATIANCFAQILFCENYKEGFGPLPCGQCLSCGRFKARLELDDEKSQPEIGETHGDFHIIKRQKDKKSISIEQVREFIRILSLSSFLGLYKIGIVKHAEFLSKEAANALLKTLEEPKKNVIIILITNNISSLPKTIVSRSQILNFFPVKTDLIYDFLLKEQGASRSSAKNFSHLALGRPALALKFMEDEDFREQYKRKVNIFLDFISQDINERFLGIEELFGKATGGQESARIAESALEAWQGAARDWLLLEFGYANLIRHKDMEEKIRMAKNKLKLKDLFYSFKLLEQGRDYLKANVNPRLVLENVAINIY